MLPSLSSALQSHNAKTNMDADQSTNFDDDAFEYNYSDLAGPASTSQDSAGYLQSPVKRGKKDCNAFRFIQYLISIGFYDLPSTPKICGLLFSYYFHYIEGKPLLLLVVVVNSTPPQMSTT